MCIRDSSYSEQAVQNGVTAAKADLIGASMPYRLLGQVQKPLWDKIRTIDSGFYNDLEAAGFQLDFGPDETGLAMKYLRRGSGYYIDVGASQLVIDGRIKLVGGQVEEVTPAGVVLDNGTELFADVIVYHATGTRLLGGEPHDATSSAPCPPPSSSAAP